jgi:osmoprotectant transport system ATP-binding protein
MAHRRHVLARSPDPSFARPGAARDGAPPEPDLTGIEIRELRKSYGDLLALDVPSLDVAPRSTLALIGPSGCGKSTLLRLIVGLIAPDRGAIRVAGLPMTRASRRDIRLHVGYVIQEGGLFPHLTARDNVALVARDLGWEAPRIRSRIDALLELVRLPAAALERYPVQLSGGQRQRVALMRALMLDPGVLLMDEPLAALDPMIRADLQRELAGWFARLRKTVLLVTHDIAEASYLGDEIAIMRAGRVVQRGSFEALDTTPAEPFVTDFIRAQRPPGARGRETT